MSSRKLKRSTARIVEHLRDTITPEMAEKAYRCRFDRELSEDEYEAFVDQLITEHYNAGLDDWDEKFLFFD